MRLMAHPMCASVGLKSPVEFNFYGQNRILLLKRGDASLHSQHEVHKPWIPVFFFLESIFFTDQYETRLWVERPVENTRDAIKKATK